MRISDWSSDVCSSDLLDLREVAAQLRLGCDQRQLVDLQQRDLARAVLGALPAQLQADRSACAGDQDAAATQPAADRLPVRRYRLPPEQVLDRDFLQFARQRTAFEQVVEPRDGAERQAGALAGLDRKSTRLNSSH